MQKSCYGVADLDIVWILGSRLVSQKMLKKCDMRSLNRCDMALSHEIVLMMARNI